MTTYQLTRIDPKVDPLSNEVHRWVFGYTGSDSESGVTAYADGVIDVSDLPLKRYMDYTQQEIDGFAGECNVRCEINERIQTRINAKIAKLNKPKGFKLSDLKES